MKDKQIRSYKEITMSIINAIFKTNKKYFKKLGLSYPSIDEIHKGYELLDRIKADMEKYDKTKEV